MQFPSGFLMGRWLARCVLLAWLTLASAGASKGQQGGPSPKATRRPLQDNRVIVRFSESTLLQRKTRELAGRPGVLKAKALEHVGMAIVACNSLEAQEQLMLELHEDPLVELATPDTRVHFDGATQGLSGKKGQERPFQDVRQCSAQSGCAALGLVGQCCPAADGLMLACCDGQVTQNQVTFKSFHGKYMVAEADGTVNVNRVDASDWETFQLIYNTDGTVSLRTHFGKYVSADDEGAVAAHHHLIGDPERLHLVNNDDGSVSLRSSFGKYVAAGLDGKLLADRESIADWEKFAMRAVGSSNQRFPNDVNFTALWGMNELQDQDIDAPEAWQTFTGEFSAGIVVAVIDTGIDYTHEDLRDNMWVNPGEIPGNGIDDDGNGFVDDIHGADFANEDGDPMDDQLHGTHCAGTIAGVGNNGIGVTGVAWHGVKLMALKFLDSSGSGQTSDAVEAINYAVAHGAKIASNSWGGGGSTAALRSAIEQAEAAGILFVAAAGNSGSDNDADPHYPSNYASDNIISVASTTASGELSGFSCYGATTVDVAAPGSRIYSTAPKQGYKFLSGTSMATPHVSGLAALVWMYRPSLSMMQVKDVLMSSVERYDALKGKVLTDGRINARKALEVASTFEPPYPPLHAPKALRFEDTNQKVGLIAGSVTIVAATDESDVDYYKVYFVSRAGYQLEAVGSVNATGAPLLKLAIGPRSIPHFGVGLVAVAGNATGEMPAQIGGHAPNVTVEDFVMPESGPRAVSWEGDVDLRHGFVAGKLSVTRAVDESSITHYNVYWSNNPGERGAKVGSIASDGFMMPKCTGPTCSEINMTTVEGGHAFDHVDYLDGEQATISASGPATVRLTRFDTESYYDTLTIGNEQISGTPKVPQKLDLPAGPLSITWLSDDSVTGTGWSFDLLQTGATAEFKLEATVPHGRGLEVVPAYGSNELLEGVFVELVDFDGSMPPSPGFAPTSLRFVDTDSAVGIVAGVAEVVPAPGATHAGSVAYYQINFADADGNAIGQGMRADADGNRSVLVTMPAVTLSKGVAKVIVRAGNDFGLSAGQTSTDIVDVFREVPLDPEAVNVNSAAARDKELHAVKFDGRESNVKAARPGDLLEPWLQQPGIAEEKHVVWPPHSTVLLSANRVVDSYVSCAVTLPGLDAHAIAALYVREAFKEAIHAEFPFAGPDSVTITKVLSASKPAATAKPASIDGKGATAMAATVQFWVEPGRDAPPHAVDRIEAKLILLGLGGPGAERFNRELVRRLGAAGVKLPAGVRPQVRHPQQVTRKRSGRALAAAASAVADDEPARTSSSGSLRDEEESQAPLLAAAAAAISAALASVAALVLVRRKRGRAFVQEEGSAALNGVHIQPGIREEIAIDKAPCL